MTRTILKYVALIALTLLFSVSSASAQDKIRTVIIDGQTNHNWAETTPYLVKILEDAGIFEVDVATAPGKGGDMSKFNVDFSKYDLVVMNYNGDRWNPEMDKAFVKFVVDGGGFLSYHAGNNAFANWPAYNEMIGLHFLIRPINPTKPVRSSLPILLHPHQIRLRIRLAVLHVEGRHHQLLLEDVGEVPVQALQQRRLSAARHHHRHHPTRLHLAEQFIRPWHPFSLRALVEQFTLVEASCCHRC